MELMNRNVFNPYYAYVILFYISYFITHISYFNTNISQ